MFKLMQNRSIRDINISRRMFFGHASTVVIRIFLSLLLLSLCLAADCQIGEFEYVDSSLMQNDQAGAQQQTDNAEDEEQSLYLYPVSIPADSVKVWKADTRFGYMKTLDSLLKQLNREQEAARKKQRGARDLDDPWNSGNRNGKPSAAQKFLSSGIAQGIFWALAIALICFIVYKLILNRGQFRANTSKPAVNNIEPEPAIAETPAEYDGLIQQSYRLSDFRMAVRYLFLKSLSLLSTRGLIHLSSDKTNMQYLRELDGEKQKEFAKLIMRYEYIWYGHLELSRSDFEQTEKLFTNFYNNI